MNMRLIILLLLVMVGSFAFGSDVTFPSDAGIIDVKRDYGAVGNGVADDTAALNAACRAGEGAFQTVYLPPGTYLVSSPIHFQTWMLIQGAGASRTTIKLKDTCPGYTNPTAWSWVVASVNADPATQRGTSGEYVGGAVNNTAFSSYLCDLTVSTGSGNPGAVGVHWISNNGGGLRDVDIRSEDGVGLIGLDLRNPGDGPCLYRNVRIQGFDVGVEAYNSLYLSVFENLTLSAQRVVGLRNRGHATVVRNLLSTNTVPAAQNLVNGYYEGHLTLIGGTCTGGAANQVAVTSDNPAETRLVVRDLSTSGYRAAVRVNGTDQPGTSVVDYASSPIETQFPGPAAMPRLPIEETPDVAWPATGEWVNVRTYQSLVINDDWAPAIQAAIDSGKAAVYMPKNGYRIKSTILVRGGVRWIQGCGSSFVYDPALGSNPCLRVGDGSGPVVIERLSWEGNFPNAIAHAGNKTLVTRLARYASYRSEAACGNLFLDDMVGGPYDFAFPQRVWARAMNCEGTQTMITNRGATVWVLGWKSEGNCTVAYNTTAGARTEILGGMIYPATDTTSAPPAFINQGGDLGVMVALFYAGQHLVEETHGGVTRTFTRSSGTGQLHFRGSPQTTAQVLTTITVLPSTASVVVGSNQTFSALALDQNGALMSTQPTFNWGVAGGGTISNSGVFLASGTAGGPFTVTATSGLVSGTAQVSITATAVAPSITNAAPGNGIIGVAYSHLASVSGTGPMTWTLSSGALPPGLNLNGTSGAITGTPTSAGTFMGVLKVSGAVSPAAMQGFTIIVSEAGATSGGDDNNGSTSTTDGGKSCGSGSLLALLVGLLAISGLHRQWRAIK